MKMHHQTIKGYTQQTPPNKATIKACPSRDCRLDEDVIPSGVFPVIFKRSIESALPVVGGGQSSFVWRKLIVCQGLTNRDAVCASPEVSSKPQRRAALTQGGMTQDPGLEAWESFSGVR